MGATRTRPGAPVRSRTPVDLAPQRSTELTVEQAVGLARRGGKGLTPQAVQRLQATAGNAAVAELLARRHGTRRPPQHSPTPTPNGAHPRLGPAVTFGGDRQDVAARATSLEPVTAVGTAAVQRRGGDRLGEREAAAGAATEFDAGLGSLQRLAEVVVPVQRGCGCGGGCGGCGPTKDDEPDSAPQSSPVQRLHQAPDSTAPVVSQRFFNPVAGVKNLAEKAEKKLAEKVMGVIRSLGASAWNTAKSLGMAAWNNAKGAGSGILNAAKSAGGTLLTTTKSLGTSAWNTAKSLGTSAWNTAKSAGARVWNTARSVGSGVWNTAKGLGSRAWSGAKSLGSKILSGAKAIGGRAWGAVRGFGGAALGKVKGLAVAAFHGAKRLGGRAWGLAQQAVGKLSVSNLCKAVGAVMGKAIARVSPAVKAAWNATKRLGTKAWNKAKTLGRAVASTASRWAGKATRFATTAVSGAYRSVKATASKAWNTAKTLGTRAFSGAKQAAGVAWNTAKGLGTKAFSTAKALGTQVLGKAKALGSAIAKGAQAAGRKVLELADKLTGGVASKVAGVASKILDKAAGVLSWVMNTAKSLASKAINTAKDLGAKAISAAKNAAAKAWQTAKQGAATALNTAKQWGTKAFNTAKSLATQAWSTAKQWGTKAVSTAKSWAGKAWSTAKSWGGKAWGAIKSGAGKVWNATKSAGKKAWGYAKGVGRGALKVAKAVGLDKAWNTAKNLGGKALGAVKSAAAALKKRFQPVLDVVGKGAELLKKAAPAILGGPAFLACKVLGCATPKLVNKGNQTSKEAADIATDVIPGVSTVKDTCRCLTGDNIVTGKEESAGGRIMGCIWAAVDIASIIAGLVSGGTGTVAVQAIKTAARAGLRAMIKTIGKLGFRGLVDLAIDLVKRAWKKLLTKVPEALKAARQWAADTLKLGAGILKNLSLEAIERLKKLPAWVLNRLKALSDAAKRAILGCASACDVDDKEIIRRARARALARALCLSILGRMMSYIYGGQAHTIGGVVVTGPKVKRGIIERYTDLLEDKQGLYVNHRTTAQAHPRFGSWNGHVQQMRDLQNVLGEARGEWYRSCAGPRGGALSVAASNFVLVADKWANMTVPPRPRR
jgi:phage-related protein